MMIWCICCLVGIDEGRTKFLPFLLSLVDVSYNVLSALGGMCGWVCGCGIR